MKYCNKCGKALNDYMQFCDNCGAKQEIAQNNATPTIKPTTLSLSNESDKSRTVAALLAFFLGGFGIHNFYLGNVLKGVGQLVLTLLMPLVVPIIACYIWVLVDFIMILVGKSKDGNGKIVSNWDGKK